MRSREEIWSDVGDLRVCDPDAPDEVQELITLNAHLSQCLNVLLDIRDLLQERESHRVVVKDGDVIVASCPEHCGEPEAARILEDLRQTFPKHECRVLHDGVRLGVMSDKGNETETNKIRTPARIRRISFTPEFLIALCKTSTEPMRRLFTCEGLPEDAQFVKACVRRHGVDGSHAEGNCTIDIIVHSESFFPDGEPPQDFRPVFHEFKRET